MKHWLSNKITYHSVGCNYFKPLEFAILLNTRREKFSGKKKKNLDMQAIGKLIVFIHFKS